MTGNGYVILAYVIGLGLLWGHALALLIASSKPAAQKTAE